MRAAHQLVETTQMIGKIGEVCVYFIPDDFPSAERDHARLCDGRGGQTPAREPLVFHLIEPKQPLALGL
jgi:hypothetical protein